MDIWSILRTFGQFYGHLVQFVALWYTWLFGIFFRFGKYYQEKSGSHDQQLLASRVSVHEECC
jgi:hypothetical protein